MTVRPAQNRQIHDGTHQTASQCDSRHVLRLHGGMQALSGSTSPQSLVPASQRLPSGLRYDSVSGYAKAAAVTGGKQLLGLGEAGYKYMSSQYGQWRSGSWEGASTRYRCSCMDPLTAPVVLRGAKTHFLVLMRMALCLGPTRLVCSQQDLSLASSCQLCSDLPDMVACMA